MKIHEISPAHLSIARVAEIVKNDIKIKLSEQAKKRIKECRSYLDKKIKESEKPIYGINTGFGSLCKVSIPAKDLEQLQTNLVLSHACGTGAEVPQEIVRIMILLKIQSLSYGHSGVVLETVERLVDFYNEGIYPVVYEQGSLGASGDLAPLAHLSLPLLGLGEVNYKGKKQSTAQVYKKLNFKPLKLKSKEGLALLNGTQFMGAYGVYCLIEAKRLSEQADTIGAISLEGFNGRLDAFDDLTHVIRIHKGQLETARNFQKLLKGSKIIEQKDKAVQDPYSFRCIPQVHGASKDTIEYVTQVFTQEINSVTDNPLIFPKEDRIISGGNFHGQPLALALDFLGIAVSELGSISERRTYQLISGLRNLPDFLVKKPGLNSGLMIPQYTAASIASQNKQLCTPASADSIVSSNGQEDHVSMGANAATKTLRIVENTEKILAIELLNGTQAIEFRRPLKTSAVLEKIIKEYRKTVPAIENDRYLHNDIAKSIAFLKKI